jgi:hypothetical protein
MALVPPKFAKEIALASVNLPTNKPIRKVVIGAVAAIVVPGVIGILSLGANLFTLTWQEWLLTLIGFVIIPVLQYFVPSAPQDVIVVPKDVVVPEVTP